MTNTTAAQLTITVAHPSTDNGAQFSQVHKMKSALESAVNDYRAALREVRSKLNSADDDLTQYRVPGAESMSFAQGRLTAAMAVMEKLLPLAELVLGSEQTHAIVDGVEVEVVFAE